MQQTSDLLSNSFQQKKVWVDPTSIRETVGGYALLGTHFRPISEARVGAEFSRMRTMPELNWGVWAAKVGANKLPTTYPKGSLGGLPCNWHSTENFHIPICISIMDGGWHFKFSRQK